MHSSGKIYRRVADHSDPKPETDRYLLEKLWDKNRLSSKKLKEFIEKKAPNKNSIPVAYIYILTNPYFDKDFPLLEFSDFKETLSGKSMQHFAMPMNTFHSARGGYIARQTKYNEHLSQVTSFRWWHSGNALMTIPLNTYDKSEILKKKFDHLSDFITEIEKQKFNHVRICDLNYLLLGISTLYNQFSHLKKIINNNERTYSAIIIENTYHLTPFLDDQKYIQIIKENGIPIKGVKKIVKKY